MPGILYSPQEKYLENLRIENDELIIEMEKFAKENNVPILNWNAAELLESLITLYEPKRVLEIGTAIGYSTIRVAKNLRKKAVIDTLEKNKDNIKLAKEFINRSGFESKINIIEGDALQIMPNLETKYNFIFLDADKEDYERLFYYSLMLLKKGGLLFVDNLLWHGYAASKTVPAKYKTSTEQIRKFNKLFTSQYSLKTTILPVGDGIGIGVKRD